MIKIHSLALLLFFIFSISIAQAQGTSDGQLAKYYLESGEYEKALLYYDKLYDQNQTAEHYSGLLTTYTELGMLKDAEKLVKKQQKKYNSNVYYIDLGAVYEAQGEEKDALEAYREAINDLPQSQGMVIRTANEFLRRNKLELALETYQYGKKLLNDKYPFSYEIAGLYGTMGNTERMISEYIDLLAFNDAYLQTVQNALNRSIDFENDTENVDLLRTELLRRVQKTPQTTVYSEMLTWLFLQQKEFNSAYVQLKAIDKRLGENGQRLLNLANLCINNGAFDVARKSYQYIVDKGVENPYYAYARSGVLTSTFEELKRQFPPDTAALRALRMSYNTVLAELGFNKETIATQQERANLEAYYLSDLTAANITLNEALETPDLSPEVRAQLKLELAKILIARDYIWDASLLCSQVDKDFKNDILGFEAKYLNAKISYYDGDFTWAQAQLDVLKGSTSKLISNDAMELSLLITDNMNLDTVVEPMEMFAQAELLTVQRKYDQALTRMDSILVRFPGHALSDEILLQRAKIAEARGRYNVAADFYLQVVSDHYFDISADNALYRLAELYETKLNDTSKAQEYYKQLMVDFPGSLYVVEARKRFRAIRGDAPEKEFREIEPNKVP